MKWVILVKFYFSSNFQIFGACSMAPSSKLNRFIDAGMTTQCEPYINYSSSSSVWRNFLPIEITNDQEQSFFEGFRSHNLRPLSLDKVGLERYPRILSTYSQYLDACKMFQALESLQRSKNREIIQRVESQSLKVH